MTAPENAILPFDFEGHDMRLLMRNDVPWFVLAEVCKVLEISNSRDAASRLDDDEKDVGITDTTGGYQNMTIINESGLYSLILTSRKPAARRFKKWVTAEVLPAIRKTGAYATGGARGETCDPAPGAAILDDPAAMRTLLLGYTEKVIALQAQQAESAPKAEFYDRFVDTPGLFTLRQAARIIGISESLFMDRLRQIYMVSRGDTLMPRSTFVERGLFAVRAATGDGQAMCHTYVTAKGLPLIARAVCAPPPEPANGEACLRHLLAAHISRAETAGDLIRAAFREPTEGDRRVKARGAARRLADIGMKLRADMCARLSGNSRTYTLWWLYVSNTHPALAEIFRDTGWQWDGTHGGWGPALAALPFAKKRFAQIRIGGDRQWATPMELVGVFPDLHPGGPDGACALVPGLTLPPIVPVGTSVRYHTGARDFPAVVMSSHRTDPARAARYTLEVDFDGRTCLITGRREGSGEEQFTVKS